MGERDPLLAVNSVKKRTGAADLPITANNSIFYFFSLIRLLHGILSLHQSEMVLWIKLRSGQNFNNKSFPNSNFSFSLSVAYI